MRAFLVSHPSGDQLAMLVDDDGLPIVHASEYLLTRRGLASATTLRNARELAVLHNWVDSQGLDLEALFSAKISLKKPLFDTSLPDGLRRKLVEEEHGNVINIRSYRDVVKVVGDVVFMQRLMTARSFFVFWFQEFLGRYEGDEVRYKKILSYQDNVIGWLDKRVIRGFSNRRGDNALPNGFVSELLNRLRGRFHFPLLTKSIEDFDVPKAAYVQARNYIVTVLMLYFGLRPGEVLTLRVSDVVLGAISQINVTRRRPDPNDSRKPRPAIKANGRPLPFLSRELEFEMNNYICMLDKHMGGCRKNHEYLMVSDEGDPLSYASVNALYQQLRREIKSGIPCHLNAKSLRHTFSTNLENELRAAGVEEERRRKHLAFARGDSSLSSQEEYLAAAFMDEFNQANLRVQGELYKDGV